jgi:phospholipid/cholesterol/gamma-HCH transport system substrate-binding protein
MRHSETHDIWVGGLAMAVLAFMFAVSYGGKDLSTQANVGSYNVTAVFNRIDGLFEGDQVRLGGIPIGTVGTVSLDGHYRAVVGLNINNAITLPKDSAAAIHTDGLFGSKSVEIEPGVEDATLKSGDVFQYTQGSMIVSELLNLIIDEGNARKAKAANGSSDLPTSTPEPTSTLEQGN